MGKKFNRSVRKFGKGVVKWGRSFSKYKKPALQAYTRTVKPWIKAQAVAHGRGDWLRQVNQLGKPFARMTRIYKRR